MSKVILTEFGSRISKAVADKSKLSALVRNIENFFDRNNEIVFASDPGKRLIFATSDQENIFTFTGIIPEEVENVMLKVKIIDASWKLLNTPFVIQSVLCIRELEIKKMKKERDLLIMFLAMKFFSSRQRKSFPFEPNPHIMAYTINNLSEKYKYKKLQNNYNVIQDTVMTSHDTYTKILIEGNDEMFLVYVPQMENRIGKIMNAIAEEFYRNKDDKNYLNTEESFDDKGNAKDTDSLSANISGMADSVGYAFITNKVNMGIVRMVCERNDIPFTSLYQTLNEVRSNEEPSFVVEMMRKLFTVLATADKSLFEKVCTKEFAAIALKQITISNTTDPELISLKSDLDHILTKHCIKYAQTQRNATKMSYRTALYSYFVYLTILQKCR